MATAKKGKKTSKPKKASKPKKKSKKNNSMGFFGKFMLILLLVAVLTAGVFMVLKNIGDVKVNETTSQQVNETTSQQVNKTTSQQVNKTTSQQVNESTSQRVNESELKANSQKPKANSQKPTANSQKPIAKSQQTISGNWLSTEQGASLTMDDYGYRIDFFGVDASRPIIGKVILDDKNITFTSDEGGCKGIEGKYKITFNKKDIRLICKDDDCIERRSVLEAEWEWLEI